MRQKSYKQKPVRHFYTTNERIRGEQFRVLDEQGKQVDMMDRAQAFAYAAEQGVDLVLIAEQAQPPVVKAIDFKKFIYQEEKKEKEGKKAQSKGDTKDIQLSLFIGENDLERLRLKTLEFLHDGHQVRIKILLRGREMMKASRGVERIKSFIVQLGDEAKVVKEPFIQGRVILAIVVRNKKNEK